MICRATPRNSPTAAKIPHAPTLSRGCRRTLLDWALRPKNHITTSNEKIASYADNQLQVKSGVLIGIWDESELAAIRQKIELRAKSIAFSGESQPRLDAGWVPVRVRKTRQINAVQFVMV